MLEQSVFLSRISECLERRQMTEKEALTRAGLQVDWLRDIRRRGYEPKFDKVQKLARVLNMPPSFFVGSDAGLAAGDDLNQDVPDLVKRFRAARWACWEDKDRARRRLDIPFDELEAIEDGCSEIGERLLIHFSGITGVPLGWFRYGSMAGLPGPIAARVGLYDPSLVPDAPEEERSRIDSRQASARGGNASKAQSQR